MQFNTELLSARYIEDRNIWQIETSTNETLTCHYLVTALGLLSKQNWPAIPGRELFKGEVYHTGNWPKNYDFKGKRVGIIGNGSTGVRFNCYASMELILTWSRFKLLRSLDEKTK